VIAFTEKIEKKLAELFLLSDHSEMNLPFEYGYLDTLMKCLIRVLKPVDILPLYKCCKWVNVFLDWFLWEQRVLNKIGSSHQEYFLFSHLHKNKWCLILFNKKQHSIQFLIFINMHPFINNKLSSSLRYKQKIMSDSSQFMPHIKIFVKQFHL